MTTCMGYQPRWAEFKQGRPQENTLQTFPGRADTLCVLGIHMGPAAKQGQGPQQPSLQASGTLESVWGRPRKFCSVTCTTGQVLKP